MTDSNVKFSEKVDHTIERKTFKIEEYNQKTQVQKTHAAIKIDIVVTPDGKLDYPDLNNINAEIRNNLPWTKYIDTLGIGMQYNLGIINKGKEKYCMTVVPLVFAKAATEYTDRVKIIPESEFEAYYNEAHKNDTIEIIDYDALKSIYLRMQMEREGLIPLPSKEVVAERNRALNPEEPVLGIRKNIRKNWKEFKKHLQIVL